MPEQRPRDVMLSQQEREMLREIEAQLRDSRRAVRVSRSLAALPGWWAAALLTVGVVTLFLAAFTVSLPVALMGAALLCVGLVLGGLRLTPALAAWLQRNL